MKAHLYHVRLEVYQNHLATPGEQAYLPSSVQDIFSDSLPAHKRSEIHQKSEDRGTQDTHSGHTVDAQAAVHHDALLLPARNAALKEVAHHTTLPIAVPSEDTAVRDWRFGPILIDSIDMTPDVKTRQSPDGKRAPNQHTKALYTPSDLKTTDVGCGVVHLYKDAHETDLLAKIQQSRSAAKQETPFDIEHCTTLCILAVPSWMMPSDLLGFVGDQTRTDVSHFRLIRTGRANKYMVLMKFRQAKRAREWQAAWNGRLFSAMEPENCHVVFIKSVEFVTQVTKAATAAASDPGSHGSATFPMNTHDPFMASAKVAHAAPVASSAKPYAPPTPSLIELPTCPVCLERMDETTGLLTILCQHVFHCACLEKWRGSGCPVCRYTQSPSYTFPYPRPNSGEAKDNNADEPMCSVCASSANLWICLICGNTGCGRYNSAHAYAHYESTSHCYAMDISTQRVWDYAGDGYVHRLIQNKDDDKLIRLPGTRHDAHPNTAFRAEGDDSVPREKMEAMANEYTYLLTNQLESQRRYYEEQLERAVDKASTACQRAEDVESEAATHKETLKEIYARSESLTDQVVRLEQNLEKATLRSDKFEKMSRDLMRQVKEETAMNEGIMKRITAAGDKARESEGAMQRLQAEKAELEETNRDLTIFISSQEKIRELQEQGEEVEGADTALPEKQNQGKGKGKGRKKK